MPRTYGVYVIKLKSVRRSVYVGQSYLSPEERFENHLAGYRASRIVTKYGGKLRPDLYGHLPRYHSREQAEQAERELAQNLRARGWTVYGGH